MYKYTPEERLIHAKEYLREVKEGIHPMPRRPKGRSKPENEIKDAAYWLWYNDKEATKIAKRDGCHRVNIDGIDKCPVHNNAYFDPNENDVYCMKALWLVEG